jgi:5-methylcytosine-specific restriction endonuclease McrA
VAKVTAERLAKIYEWRKNNLDKVIASRKLYKSRHKEKLLIQNRQYLIDNPDKAKQFRRTRYLNNPEYYKKRSKEHHKSNKNKPEYKKALLIRAQAWVRENPERYQANRHGWRQKNIKRIAELARKYRKENPEQRRAAHNRRRFRKQNANGTTDKEQFKARIEMFGGICAYCNSPYEHMDHVIPLAKGGTNWPANLRPACAKCNTSKHASANWKMWVQKKSQRRM